jgi:hypothetical protein
MQALTLRRLPLAADNGRHSEARWIGVRNIQGNIAPELTSSAWLKPDTLQLLRHHRELILK